MPIFSRKSSNSSKSSRSQEDRLLTKAIKNLVSRLIICYRCICCFPLDQIVPPYHRKVRHGVNLYLKPAPVQKPQKVLPEIKIIHILPRSRVSFPNEPERVESVGCLEKRAQSEITTLQVKGEIATTAKTVKSDVFYSKKIKRDVSNSKKVKSDVTNSKKVKNDVPNVDKVKSDVSNSNKVRIKASKKQISSVSIEKVKTAKISKTRMLKEKSRKIFYYGSGSIKSTFKQRKKSNESFITTGKKKSKDDGISENRWIRTKKMMKISGPGNMKWIKHKKARSSMTTSSTDNEESAGDGLVSPKLSGSKKIPLRWILLQEQGFSDTDVGFIKNDADKQVTLEII